MSFFLSFVFFLILVFFVERILYATVPQSQSLLVALARICPSDVDVVMWRRCRII